MQKRTSTIRLLSGLALVLVVAAAGWTAWWFQLAGNVRDGIGRWAEARRADGWRVSFAAIEIDGFPGTMHVRLTDPHIVRPDGLDWQAPTVTGALSPLTPQRVRIEAPGRHAVVLPGREPLALQVDAGRATAELVIDDGGRLDAVQAVLEAVTAAAPGGERLSAEQVRADLTRSIAADAAHSASTAAFELSARGVELPPGATPVLDRRVTAATVRGRLQGEVPPGDLVPALGAWRDDGGTVEIDRLTLDWRPLSLTAEGTLALDAEMQPMMAMTASIRGFLELVDALTRQGMVKAKDAQTAKLVLGLMAKAPPEGGPPALQVPVTVQEGKLSVGPAVLGKVPPIPWPEGR